MNIAYLIELKCSGCHGTYRYTPAYEDIERLRQATLHLIEMAKEDGWTAQEDALWCHGCTIERHPAEAKAQTHQKGGAQ